MSAGNHKSEGRLHLSAELSSYLLCVSAWRKLSLVGVGTYHRLGAINDGF